MAQIATLFAGVSLALAVGLFVKVERLERDLGTARAGIRDARGAAGADAVADPLRDAAARLRDAEGARAGDGGRPAPPVSMASGASREAESLSVEDRLARLEERQQKLEGAGGLSWHGRGRRPARSVDELAQRLSLTVTQRSRIEDALGRGRQRIEDVLKIPDETGKGPFERRAEARRQLEEAMKNPGSGGIFALATELVSYRGKKIPGRGDTYADEIDRIRRETRDEIASALDARQQETFRDTSVDGLLGDAGQVSIGYAVGSTDEQRERAGLVIEMESGVVAEEGGPPPPPREDAGDGR